MTDNTVWLAQAAQWLEDDPDPDSRDQLRALMAAAADDPAAAAELADRFARPLQFGTAGLRGAMAAGPNRMNRAVVIRAARGLADYLRDSLPGQSPRLVIGHDARHHSRRFALDSAAVATAAGSQVYLFDQAVPTPLLAYAVRALGADAGVMVTASHNPAADNGYKVYLGGRMVPEPERGVQIVPPHDQAIADRIAAVAGAAQVERADSGWAGLGDEAERAYVAAIAAGQTNTVPLKIVHTAMHGVGSAIALEALTRAGFTDLAPVASQQQPDPDFPTVGFPNPEEPGAIDLALEQARSLGADLVIANDPDADRCAVAVDDPRSGWRMLHGDELGAVLGQDIAQRLARERAAAGAPDDRSEAVGAPSSGRDDQRLTGGPDDQSSASSPGDWPEAAGPSAADLSGGAGESAPAGQGAPAPVLVNSIVSSRQLGRIAAGHGLAQAQTLTGFKWMGRVPGMAFAYEEAIGYCVRPDLVHDKDGLSTAVAVARLAARLKASGQTIVDLLDDLARRHGLYLTSQLSVRFADLSLIGQTMDRLRQGPPDRLADSPVSLVADLAQGHAGLSPTDGILLASQADDRVIVRPSGTEPKVKCYLEVVRPVAPEASFEDLTVIRRQAQERLDQLKADLRTVLFA
ncbi:MAG: phospho-sugar mutase [Propionibacteriaceae bacterium]|jgi:phosphomannomutase|nr:phospho-sugar mutase [Propionibacteriaceae bacterium]